MVRSDRRRRPAPRVQPDNRLHHVVEQRDRSRIPGSDHPRLGSRRFARPACTVCLRPARTSTSARWWRSRTIGTASRPTSCSPTSTRRVTALKQRNADAPSVAALERLATWDHVVDAASGRLVLRGVRGRRVAPHLPGRDGRAALPQVLRVGRGRAAVWACTRSSGIASPRGSTTSARSRSARSRDDIYLLAARDAEERLQREWGGEGKRAWDVIHSASFDHPLAAAALPLQVAVQSRSGAGVRRRHDRDARQLEPGAAVCRVGVPVVAPDFRRRRLGPVAGDSADGPVGAPAEPVLLRSEHPLARRSGIGRSRSRARRSTAATQHRLLFVP